MPYNKDSNNLNHTAAISKILYYDNIYPIMIFSVKGNTYCCNVARKHTNNNNYFQVNIKQRTYVQKLHADTCKGYKSEETSLPIELFFSSREEKDNYA